MTTRCWSADVCWERTDGRLFCEAHAGDLAPLVPAAAGDARDPAAAAPQWDRPEVNGP
jgi:hypothetical protein